MYDKQNQNITDFIPQRAPFVMIDDLISHTKTGAISSFYIAKENILVDENCFSVSGLLENIAQTAAASVGFDCAVNNIPVPMGFIGAISKVKLSKLPLVNTTIETSIVRLQEVFDISLISGEVKQNDETIISCQMKIMLLKES